MNERRVIGLELRDSKGDLTLVCVKMLSSKYIQKTDENRLTNSCVLIYESILFNSIRIFYNKIFCSFEKKNILYRKRNLTIQIFCKKGK